MAALQKMAAGRAPRRKIPARVPVPKPGKIFRARFEFPILPSRSSINARQIWETSTPNSSVYAVPAAAFFFEATWPSVAGAPPFRSISPGPARNVPYVEIISTPHRRD